MQLDWWSEAVVTMNPRLKGLLLGLALGVLAGAIGLGVVALGPVIMFGGIAGLLVGLYVLTDVQMAALLVLAVIGLLPFGTLPFKIGFTPSLLDAAVGAFLLVYLFQWMTGRRLLLHVTPVHGLVIAFAVFVTFAFVLGVGHSMPTANIIKQFAEMIMAIATALVLVDVVRDEATLRRLMFVLLLVGGATAVIGLGLYILPDDLTELVLVRLAPFGYPNGGVVRYVEENPALAERAIGVWIDPNSFGGVLAVLGALAAPQVFAAGPLGGRRWIILAVLGAIGLCLYLTFSRTAMMALAFSMGFVAVMRYRRLLLILVLAGLLILLLPVTQDYVVRMIEGFQGADQATQMRVGEINDALKLIGRYPVFGVGFSGTPDRDIYLGVANIYLTMASNIGLVGLGVFGVLMAGFFLYGLSAWRRPGRPARFEPLWLGSYAGIVAILVGGLGDHYFFKLEFQPSVTMFWIVLGLGMAVSRLWLLAEPETGASSAAA